jgi:hypothetical protein
MKMQTDQLGIEFPFLQQVAQVMFTKTLTQSSYLKRGQNRAILNQYELQVNGQTDETFRRCQPATPLQL